MQDESFALASALASPFCLSFPKRLDLRQIKLLQEPEAKQLRPLLINDILFEHILQTLVRFGSLETADRLRLNGGTDEGHQAAHFAAGRHTVSFKWPDGKQSQQTVEVKEGKPSFVEGRKE